MTQNLFKIDENVFRMIWEFVQNWSKHLSLSRKDSELNQKRAKFVQNDSKVVQSDPKNSKMSESRTKLTRCSAVRVNTRVFMHCWTIIDVNGTQMSPQLNYSVFASLAKNVTTNRKKIIRLRFWQINKTLKSENSQKSSHLKWLYFAVWFGNPFRMSCYGNAKR